MVEIRSDFTQAGPNSRRRVKRSRRSWCGSYLVLSSCLGKDIQNADSDEKIDFTGGNVFLITTKQDWDQKVSEANENGKTVVANFSASWCGPCKLITPLYVELSKIYPSIVFLTVDVDQLTEFSTQWEIQATPTFVLLKNGQQVDKIVGANEAELSKKIVTHAESSTGSSQPNLSSQ